MIFFKSVKKQKKAVLLMTLCIVVSSFALMLSIESIYNYYYKILYGDSDTKIMEILIQKDTDFTKEDLGNLLNKIPHTLLNDVVNIYTQTYADSNPRLSKINQIYVNNKMGLSIDYGRHAVVPFHFTYQNGQFCNSEFEMDSLLNYGFLQKEELITDEQYKNGEKVIVIDKAVNPYYADRKYVELFGDKYRIIGDLKNATVYDMLVPITAIPEDINLTCDIQLYLSHPVKLTEFSKIEEIINNEYNDKLILIDMEFDNSVNRDFYVTIFSCSVIILLIALFNFLIMGNYIFSENYRRYRIYMICGAGRFSIFKEYFLFTSSIAVISLMFGFMIFNLIFKRILVNYYEYVIQNNFMIFVAVITIYIIINLIVSLIVCFRNLKTDKGR